MGITSSMVGLVNIIAWGAVVSFWVSSSHSNVLTDLKRDIT